MIVTLDTNYLKTCVMNIILMCCDSCARVDIQYTYFHESLGRYSVIDHIFVDRSFPRGGGDFSPENIRGNVQRKFFLEKFPGGSCFGRFLWGLIFHGITGISGELYRWVCGSPCGITSVYV